MMIVKEQRCTCKGRNVFYTPFGIHVHQLIFELPNFLYPKESCLSRQRWFCGENFLKIHPSKHGSLLF